MFKDREEAGNLLAEKLVKYSNQKDVVVVTIPRGGVPIGYLIAQKINAPLEIVLSKKIGHPYNKEYAIGAVTSESIILSDAANEVSKVYIDSETEKIRELLKKRYQQYYGKKNPINFKNKTVILIDDGVATGNTMISSIQLIAMQKPSKLIVALPVAPPSAFNKIKNMPEVTEVICLIVESAFSAVGQFYEAFYQVNDEEVIDLLNKSN